jgi:hypothetical protein
MASKGTLPPPRAPLITRRSRKTIQFGNLTVALVAGDGSDDVPLYGVEDAECQLRLPLLATKAKCTVKALILASTNKLATRCIETQPRLAKWPFLRCICSALLNVTSTTRIWARALQTLRPPQHSPAALEALCHRFTVMASFYAQADVKADAFVSAATTLCWRLAQCGFNSSNFQQMREEVGKLEKKSTKDRRRLIRRTVATVTGLCGGCGQKAGDAAAKFSRCGRCKETCYCSRACQAKHWPTHRTKCAQLKTNRQANKHNVPWILPM